MGKRKHRYSSSDSEDEVSPRDSRHKLKLQLRRLRKKLKHVARRNRSGSRHRSRRRSRSSSGASRVSRKGSHSSCDSRSSSDSESVTANLPSGSGVGRTQRGSATPTNENLRSCTPSESGRRGDMEVEDQNSDSSVLMLNDEDLPQEIVSILGKDPETDAVVKCEFHNAIKSRWSYWLTHGLQEIELSEAKERVILPSNVYLEPPLINPEILPILNKHAVSRDRALSNYQSLLGLGLAELGKACNLLLQPKEKPPDPQKVLSHLSDTGRFLTHLFFDLSKSRRQFVLPTMNKSVRDVAEGALPSAELLFGPNLADLIKTAKQLETTGKEIKAPPFSSSVAAMPNYRTRFSPQKRGGRHAQSDHLNRYRPVRRPKRDTAREARPYRGHLSRQDTQVKRKR